MKKIHHHTELMDNQRVGSVLPAPNTFECFQNSDGQPIFFFIDGDQTFGLCAAQSADETGWLTQSLSHDLSAQNGGKAISAKTFDVSQNYATGAISIALAVSVAGEPDDKLYLLTGLSNAPDASWMTSASDRDWLVRAYDGPPLQGALKIHDLYMKASMESHIVCELQNETTQALTAYKLASSGTPGWTTIAGADNFTTLLAQIIGEPASASFPGLYQLAEDASSTKTLKFLPLHASDSPITLAPPTGAAGIATLSDEVGDTDLYVVAERTVYRFSAADQTTNATGTEILDHTLLSGVRDFHCNQNADYTILWGVNSSNQVFYSKCEKGKEGTKSAWSTPIPIFEDVVRLSTYFSDSNSESVVFLHKQDGALLKYLQEPLTTQWQRRQILLPPAQIADHVGFKSFTTHVSVSDANNIPLPHATMTITPSSPCSVSINGKFYFLAGGIAKPVQSDSFGSLTIIQETQNVSAVCYTIGMIGNDAPTPVVVNPMAKVVDTMKAVKTGTDLGNIMVTNSAGQTSHLVGPHVSSATKDAVANAIQHFTGLVGSMPQNGTVQYTPPQLTALLAEPHIAIGFDLDRHAIWGVDFEGEQVTFHQGADAIGHFGLTLNANGTLNFGLGSSLSFFSFIKSLAGDVYRFAKNTVSAVKKFLVSHVGNVIKVFVHIGEAIYQFVANCISDVVHAINVVFDKIAVTFEKLVQWLGFIFQWSDIHRTHQVTKNIIKQFLRSIPDDVRTIKDSLDVVFTDMEIEIAKWARLTSEPNWNRNFGGAGRSIGGIGGANGDIPAMRSPQANYAKYHLHNNLGNATLGSGSYTPPTVTTQMQNYMSTLKTGVEAESTTLESAKRALEKDVIPYIDTLSFGDFLKKILGILAELVVDSVKNLADTALDLFADLIDNVVDLLDTPLDIPIISSLYHTATGGTLSVLDAFCFVASMGGTVVFKVMFNAAPFPDNTLSRALIAATSWAEIQAAYNPTHPTVGGDVIQPHPADPGKAISTILAHIFGMFGAAYTAATLAGEDFSPKIKGVAFVFCNFPEIVRRAIMSITGHITIGQNIANATFGIAVGMELAGLVVSTRMPEIQADWDEFDRGIGGLIGVVSIVPPVLATTTETNGYHFATGITSLLYQINRLLGAMMTGPAEPPRIFVARIALITAFGVGQAACAVIYAADNP